MIKVLEVKLNVLSRAILGRLHCEQWTDVFNDCEQWAANQWMTCENKDVMEGILDIKSKYKASDLKFECFHNRGHPETCLLQKKGEGLQCAGTHCGNVRGNCGSGERQFRKLKKCSDSSRTITV
jgi:hypothetical protein